MFSSMKQHLTEELRQIRDAGLFKGERVIVGPQRSRVGVLEHEPVLNLCANNYLGLADNPEVIAAARDTLDQWGYGLSSVRFICGTQLVHKTLEKKVSDFLGTEDTILFAACFDANGGVFEPFLDRDCAILTDSLNHASVIDGIRLCKAQRLILDHMNMEDLEDPSC